MGKRARRGEVAGPRRHALAASLPRCLVAAVANKSSSRGTAGGTATMARRCSIVGMHGSGREQAAAGRGQGTRAARGRVECFCRCYIGTTYGSNQFAEGSAAAALAPDWLPAARWPGPGIGRQTCHDTVQSRTTSIHFEPQLSSAPLEQRRAREHPHGGASESVAVHTPLGHGHRHDGDSATAPALYHYMMHSR